MAATVRVDFDGSAVDVGTTPYRESGVTFTVVRGHYGIFGRPGERVFTVDNVFNGPVEILITFDGGPFDMLRFDATDAPPANAARLTSDLGDSFIVPDAAGRQVFPTTFDGVSAITLTYDTSVPFTFNAFTIDERMSGGSGGGGSLPPVPLPASLPMLGAVLGVLGFAARRRGRSGA